MTRSVGLEAAPSDRLAVTVPPGLAVPESCRIGATLACAEAECQILQKLDHEAIVVYRDHGISDAGNGYLVMDYVAGESLQAILDQLDGKRPLGPIASGLLESITQTEHDTYKSDKLHRRVARILSTVADALAHAHRNGVVHRDVKPANILLRADLSPVLIDFGLGSDLFRSVTLTRSGAVFGTLSYMAPEQLAGPNRRIDARADTFSLGLVPYRLVVGKDLRTRFSHVIRAARGPYLLDRRAISHLPDSLIGILYACLDHRPHKRYSSIEALGDDLRAFLGAGIVNARAPGPIARFLRSRAHVPVLFASLLVATGVTVYAATALPTHVLSVDALFDGGELRIDNGEPLETPLDEFPIAPGRHELVYSGNKMRTIRRDFMINRYHTRLTLLNLQFDQIHADRTVYSGNDASFLLPIAGTGEDELWIDGKRYRHDVRWIALAPGPHTLRARSPEGREEQQVVRLLPAELHLTHLLYRGLREVAGSFRITLANVMSPRPANVRLFLDDGAVKFVNDFQEAGKPEDQLATHCYITSVVPDEEVTAMLEVEFGKKRMRSLVFFVASKARRASSVIVEYRTEGQPWRAVTDQLFTITQAKLSERGTRFFQLRGRITVKQKPVAYSWANFLYSYMDRNRQLDSPCFALVADEDPTVTRLK